jgi:hypothetical protein
MVSCQITDSYDVEVSSTVLGPWCVRRMSLAGICNLGVFPEMNSHRLCRVLPVRLSFDRRCLSVLGRFRGYGWVGAESGRCLVQPVRSALLRCVVPQSCRKCR